MANILIDLCTEPQSVRGWSARPVHWLLGLPFDAITLDEAVDRISQAVRKRTPLFLSTPNLNFLIASQTNPAFQHSVLDSDLSVADGIPIVWIARLLGVPIPERVAGSDIFQSLMRGDVGPIKVYLFGGENGVAKKAASRIRSLNGPLSCVGYYSPGFGSIEQMSSPAIIAEINASGADFVIVALGAAKGQAWIEKNRNNLNAPVISHLGAVINFAAGTVNRAPEWMRKWGTEWVWRIKEEPKLLKRYFFDGCALIGLFLRNILPAIIRGRAQLSEVSHDPAFAINLSEKKIMAVFKDGWLLDKKCASKAEFIEYMKDAEEIEVFLEKNVQLNTSVLGLIFLIRWEALRAGIGYKMTLEDPNDRLSRDILLHRASALMAPLPKALRHSVE
jgi:N-acetylglucosaminyldiphosphoundecaprenol N-acetyl-beta-D-mannosaminyltransferase